MVAAFKKPKGAIIPASDDKFNEKKASPRIISEHTIGLLKGRFPWLRSISLKVTEDKPSIRNILRMVHATLILHNILVEFSEDDRQEWIPVDEDSFSILMTLTGHHSKRTIH